MCTFSLARFYTISFNFHLFSLCYTLAVAVIVLHCTIVWHVRGQSLALCYFQLNYKIRDIFTMEDEQKLVCDLSNDAISNDLE